MKSMKTVLLRCLCAYVPMCLCASPLQALELSLEENKGESGTVGYVDIDRVFKEYSGTLEAREEFLGEIKKKEESVNQRKRVVYALKADIAKLRQERAFAMTLPSLLATEEQLNQAAAQSAESTATLAASSAPAVETSPAAAENRPPAGLPPGLPGIEAPVPAAAASVSTDAAVPISTAAPVPPPVPAAVSTSTATGDPLQPQSAAPAQTEAPSSAATTPPGRTNMPGMASVPADYFKFSVSTSVADIDAAITVKETDLKQKEDELKLYQRQIEKELLEYESHRSEIVLGRIYVALKELAVKTGVSVVVDKRNILFGQQAVDLTDKLLAALEEAR